MREIGVALVGLGNVGRAAARLIQANDETFRRRLGAGVRLRWICDRRPAKKLAALRLRRGFKVTTDPDDVLADPSVQVVIELIGGENEARRLVLGALRAGKHVVTANKLLLSRRWEEVFRAASAAGRSVLYEASVAGGIPVLRAVHESLVANRLTGLTGILNGTTNYILSRMAHDGLERAAALAEAQRLGMAERDPYLDVSGWDTAHKLSILASLMTGAWVRPEGVHREGIEGVERQDVDFAIKHFKRTVRLLGIVRVDADGGLEARVHPALVPLEHPLAAVHAGYNGVQVETSAAGDLMFFGRGAGPEPAASAVVGDLFAVCREILGEKRPALADALWPGAAKPRLAPMSGVVSAQYLRFEAADQPGVLSSLTGALGACGVSIAQLVQRPAKPGRATIVIETHPARESEVDRALARIRALKITRGRAIRLRMHA